MLRFTIRDPCTLLNLYRWAYEVYVPPDFSFSKILGRTLLRLTPSSKVLHNRSP